MKKRILSLLLTVLLLSGLLPLSAASTEDGGDGGGVAAGIDHSRIRRSVSFRLPVTVSVGETDFRGWLKNGPALTEDELDAVISEVAAEEGVTEEFLLRAEEAERRAAEAEPDFDFYAYLELAGRFLDAGTAEESGTERIMERLERPSADALLLLLADCENESVKGLTERLRRSEALRTQADFRLVLMDFYEKLSRRVGEREAACGSAEWTLCCSRTETESVDFMGVTVPQYRTLELRLTREAAAEAAGASDCAGSYAGSLRLEIRHDLSAFDEAFLEKVFFSNAAMRTIALLGGTDFRDSVRSASELSLSVSDPTARVELRWDGEESWLEGKLRTGSGLSETAEFRCDHTVCAFPQGALLLPGSDGGVRLEGMAEDESCTLHRFTGSMDALRAELEMEAQSVKADGTTPVTDSIRYAFTSDSGMYRDIRLGAISVRFGWGEDYEWIK